MWIVRRHRAREATKPSTTTAVDFVGFSNRSEQYRWTVRHIGHARLPTRSPGVTKPSKLTSVFYSLLAVYRFFGMLNLKESCF